MVLDFGCLVCMQQPILYNHQKNQFKKAMINNECVCDIPCTLVPRSEHVTMIQRYYFRMLVIHNVQTI